MILILIIFFEGLDRRALCQQLYVVLLHNQHYDNHQGPVIKAQAGHNREILAGRILHSIPEVILEIIPSMEKFNTHFAGWLWCCISK